MKFGKRLKIAFDICLSESRKFVLGMFTVLIALMMVEMVCILKSGNNVYSKRIEQGIRYDLSDVYYINMMYGGSKMVMEEVGELPEIYAMGGVQHGMSNTSNVLSFLRQVQKGHQKFIDPDEYNSGRMIETHVITEGFWDIANIKLSSGKEPSEYEFNDNTVLLYLSEEYKDIVNIGEHYYAIHKTGIVVYDYIIAGFIAEDSKIIAQGTGIRADELLNSGYYQLDYAIIEVFDAHLSGAYVCFDDDNYEEVQAKIENIGNRYNTQIDIYSLKSVIRHANDSNAEISGIILEIGVLFAVVLSVFLITVQMGRVIMKSGDYGVWLVNGMTLKDVRIVILCQNIISFMAPLIISLVASYCWVMHEYGEIVDTGKMITDIYIKSVVPKIVLISIVLIAVVTSVPWIILRKKTASEILKGDL